MPYCIVERDSLGMIMRNLNLPAGLKNGVRFKLVSVDGAGGTRVLPDHRRRRLCHARHAVVLLRWSYAKGL